MTNQKIKDALWRLDEAAERLASAITQQTGLAWKAAVEPGSYGNWHLYVAQARVTASQLHDLLYRAETELYEEEDERDGKD